MKEYILEDTGEFSKAIKLLTSVDFIVLCPEDREAELKATEELQTQISMLQTDREERKQLVEDLREGNEELKVSNANIKNILKNQMKVINGSRKEIEALTKSNKELTEKVKQQDKEYVSNGSIQEWKDYSERTTAKINELTESNKELLGALKDCNSFLRLRVSGYDKNNRLFKAVLALIQSNEGTTKKE